MSEDVMSRGLMAPILNPIEDVAELSEQLWDDGSDLQISYDGTLAWIETRAEDGYGLSFGTVSEFSPEELGAAGIAYGLNIATDQARPFSCLWYNGCDSDMSLLSAEKFLQRTGQC